MVFCWLGSTRLARPNHPLRCFSGGVLSAAILIGASGCRPADFSRVAKRGRHQLRGLPCRALSASTLHRSTQAVRACGYPPEPSTGILNLVSTQPSFRRLRKALPPFHPAGAPGRAEYTRDDFVAEFPREGGLVERKTGLGNRPLQETIVAFSNSEGGVILVGVEDGGRIQGRRLSAGVEEAILDAVADAREASVPDFHEVTVDGVPVVVVAVARKVSGVAQTSDGRVLVRRGARNRSLFGADLVQLLQEKSQEPFENSDGGVSVADVPEEHLEQFRDVFGWSREDTVDGLSEHGLLRNEGRRLTVAGVLLLLPEPPARFQKAAIEVRRYRDDGTNYEVRHSFSGQLHKQLTQAYETVVAELGNEIVLAGAYRQEIPRLPRDVLREALSNAVAHRRYDLTGQRCVVEIRPDRVVIISPGGLVDGVRLERLRSAQAARNNTIISVLRALSLAEDSGRGIDLIEDEMKAAMLESPRFTAGPDEFTVTLPLGTVVSRQERAWVIDLERRGLLRGSDKLVVVGAARKGAITNSDVREFIKADSQQARESLRRLVDAGILARQGERGGAAYTVSEGFADLAGPRLDDAAAKARLMVLAEQGALTNERARDELQVDSTAARRLLAELVREGKLTAHGRTRDRHYALAEVAP